MGVEDAGGIPPIDNRTFRELMDKIKGREAQIPTSIEDVYAQLFGEPGNLSGGEMMKKILETYPEEDYMDFIFQIMDPKEIRAIMDEDVGDDIDADWEKLQKRLRDEGLFGGEDDVNPKQ